MLHKKTRGFSLVEMLVVVAIIGILISLLLPAVQAARAAARRAHCMNNLKQLSLGMHTYHDLLDELPPGTLYWEGQQRGSNYNRWFYDHGWYSQMGPYIDQEGWFRKINFGKSFSNSANKAARKHKIPLFACPEDGIRENEWTHDNKSRPRGNYAVNFGNTNYGQSDKSGVPFDGAPFAPLSSDRFADINDGQSNTLLMGEVLTVLGSSYGSPISEVSICMGGQTFNGWLTPNSPAGDDVTDVSFGDEDRLNDMPIPNYVSDRVEQSFALRSHHKDGVHASLCDGSVRFFTDLIDLAVWRALSTSRGGETIDTDAF